MRPGGPPLELTEGTRLGQQPLESQNDASAGKESACSVGDLGSIPGSRRSLTAFLRPPKVPRHAGFPRGWCRVLCLGVLGSSGGSGVPPENVMGAAAILAKLWEGPLGTPLGLVQWKRAS